MSKAITVTLYGKKKIDISAKLISLSVMHELNQIPSATVTLATGNFAERSYPLFEETSYEIGAELDIKIRYENSGGEDISIFKGIITKQKFESRNGLPLMTLGLNDPAFRLLDATTTELFKNKNDKQMIEQTLASVSGLSLGKSNTGLTAFTFDQYVKKQTTHWRFIMDRVDAHGMYVRMDNGAMHIEKPSDTSGVVKLEVGMDQVLDLAVEEDATHLNKEITLNYWNTEKNTEEEVKQRITNKSITDAKSPVSNYVFLDITSKAEAQAMLDSIVAAQQLNQVKGFIKTPGNSSIKLMQELQLKSLPDTLNGSYPITKVTHQVRLGVWTTKIGIGYTNYSLLNTKSQNMPEVLQNKDVEIAKALKWKKDPEGLGRIPVEVMVFGKEEYWAYPAQMATGKKQRSFILPEEGEQVVVGFMHNSYNQGVVLTSVYLKDQPPKAPFKMDSKSPVGFVSSTDMRLIFDDEKKEVQLTTPDENKIVLSDKSGMKLDSKKDIAVESKAKYSLKASAKVTIKGKTIDLN